MKRILSGVCVVMLALASADIFAADLPIKQFQAGDVISADDVNGNFQTLSAAMQQMQRLLADLETRNTTLESEVAALNAKIAILEKQLAASSTNKQQPVIDRNASSKTVKSPLRSEPKTISARDVQELLKTDWRDIENDFSAQGDVVIDHATGLMWQKAGSDLIPYAKTQEYIHKLNQTKFAGYADWRLPTIDELRSLVENKPVGALYLNPVFNFKQSWCWSSDKPSFDTVWIINFVISTINSQSLGARNHVRAVRSLKP